MRCTDLFDPSGDCRGCPDSALCSLLRLVHKSKVCFATICVPVEYEYDSSPCVNFRHDKCSAEQQALCCSVSHYESRGCEE